jgi:hypothetical protein
MQARPARHRHRIEAGNVVLEHDHVKVLTWLAKLMASIGPPTSVPDGNRRRRVLARRHMAPEQAEGAHGRGPTCSSRIMFYEMLTGERPPRARTTFEIELDPAGHAAPITRSGRCRGIGRILRRCPR